MEVEPLASGLGVDGGEAMLGCRLGGDIGKFIPRAARVGCHVVTGESRRNESCDGENRGGKAYGAQGRGSMLQHDGAEVGVGVKMQACNVWCVLDEEGERVEDGDELGVNVVDTDEAKHMAEDVCCGSTCE